MGKSESITALLGGSGGNRVTLAKTYGVSDNQVSVWADSFHFSHEESQGPTTTARASEL